MKAQQEAKRNRKAAAKLLQAEKQKQSAAEKAARRALKQKKRQESALQRRQFEAKRKAEAEARRVAFAAYVKTPAYAAKVAREAERLAEMKKSHLQVWVETETGLNEDRQSLKEQWREKLLKPRKPAE